jgi:lantibiotic transport system ATP-binding protein
VENIISLSHLNFSYSGKKVLDDFSMQVPTHSIFGLLGPNGSGKTTTIRLILGLLPHIHGTIHVFGKEIRRDRIPILRQVGALVEVPSLYLHLSGFDNIEITRKLIGGLPQSRTDEVLELVGLKSNANRTARTYSLGMKQRLGIALALLNKPRLLILDEPSNGLDPSGIKEMRELIIELNKNEGTTILISSHLLSEMEKTATHIGIIKSGQCVFQGSLENLHALSNRKIFKIKVDNVPFTLRSIQSLPGIEVIRVDEIQHWVYLQVNHTLSISNLNKLLVQNDVSVTGIEPETSSLEHSFMELTETKDERNIL